jgi:hypothetical protein
MQWWWSEDVTHLKNVERRYGNWKRFKGFGFGSFQGTLVAPLASPNGRISSRCVIMRWPLLAALFTIAPVWSAYLAFQEKEREERIIRGLCRHCGYDLRGAGGICPECGKGGGKDVGSMQKVI